MECPVCRGTGEVQIGAGAIPATNIGRVLKEARERKRLSLRQVETVSGLSNALISQIENGRIKAPSFHSLVSLCGVYGVDIMKLVSKSTDNYSVSSPL